MKKIACFCLCIVVCFAVWGRNVDSVYNKLATLETELKKLSHKIEDGNAQAEIYEKIGDLKFNILKEEYSTSLMTINIAITVVLLLLSILGYIEFKNIRDLKKNNEKYLTHIDATSKEIDKKENQMLEKLDANVSELEQAKSEVARTVKELDLLKVELKKAKEELEDTFKVEELNANVNENENMPSSWALEGNDNLSKHILDLLHMNSNWTFNAVRIKNIINAEYHKTYSTQDVSDKLEELNRKNLLRTKQGNKSLLYGIQKS